MSISSNAQRFVVVPDAEAFDSTPPQSLTTAEPIICSLTASALEWRSCRARTRDVAAVLQKALEANLVKATRMLRRYDECALDNYQPAPHKGSQLRAFNHAYSFVREYPTVERGLLFMGTCGVGKTHLSVTVLSELMDMNPPSDIVWTDSWELAPVQPNARREEVHVWRAALTKTASEVESLCGLLTADEQRRAESFHFSRDRAHFIVARGILRKILGLYLRRAPDSLRFSYTPFGKPGLQDAPGFETLRFNLTHAGVVVLYAVTCGREIGIDVEYVRADIECEEIAGHFFAQREVEVLRALPPDLRSRAFFNCWTRKEAYIKARGEGLSLPLDEFNVSLSPGEPAALLSASDEREVARWSLRELTLAPEYVAALAAEGTDWRLRCWEYS